MARNPFLFSKSMVSILTYEPFSSAEWLYQANWDYINYYQWAKRESSLLVRKRADHPNKYKAIVDGPKRPLALVSMGRPWISMMTANPISRPFKTNADMRKRVLKRSTALKTKKFT